MGATRNLRKTLIVAALASMCHIGIAWATSPTLPPIEASTAAGDWQGLSIDEYGSVKIASLRLGAEPSLLVCQSDTVKTPNELCSYFKLIEVSIADGTVTAKGDTGVSDDAWQYVLIRGSGISILGSGRLEVTLGFMDGNGELHVTWPMTLHIRGPGMLKLVEVAVEDFRKNRDSRSHLRMPKR